MTNNKQTAKPTHGTYEAHKHQAAGNGPVHKPSHEVDTNSVPKEDRATVNVINKGIESKRLREVTDSLNTNE